MIYIKILVSLAIIFTIISIPLFLVLSLIGLMMDSFSLKHIIVVCLMFLPATILAILIYLKVPTRFD